MATPRPNTLRRLLLSSSWKTLNWFLSWDWFSSIFHLTFFFLPFPSYTSLVIGIHPASATLTDARHHNKTQIFPFANWRVSSLSLVRLSLLNSTSPLPFQHRSTPSRIPVNHRDHQATISRSSLHRSLSFSSSFSASDEWMLRTPKRWQEYQLDLRPEMAAAADRTKWNFFFSNFPDSE